MALIDPRARESERRSLLGLVLMFGFFFIWTQGMQSEMMEQERQRQLEEARRQATQPTTPEKEDGTGAEHAPAIPSVPLRTDLRLATGELAVQLTNAGAQVSVGRLGGYAPPGHPKLAGSDKIEDWNPFLQVVEAAGDPLAVPARAAGDPPSSAPEFLLLGPGALRVESVRPRDTLLGSTHWLVVEETPAGITFETTVAGGFRLRKRIAIDDQPWPGTEATGHRRLRLELTVINQSSDTQSIELAVYGLSGSNSEGDPQMEVMHRNPQIGYLQEGSSALMVDESITLESVLKHLADAGAGKLREQETELAALDDDLAEVLWLSLGNHYFAGVLAPSLDTRPLITGVRFHPLLDSGAFATALAAAREQAPGRQLAASEIEELRSAAISRLAGAFDVEIAGLKSQESRTVTFHFYAGPRLKKVIAPMGLQELVRSVPICGIIPVGPFARALTVCLNGVYALVGNYGWAIIVLTLIIKILLMPVNKRNQISMAKYSEKMKRFAPRQKELEARYKGRTDAASLQRKRVEMAQAMREAGITVPIPPGCLLMLLQMPIFVGLYSALQNSIELRHQAWLWVDDLGAPDRLAALPFWPHELNILPILMTIVWGLQSRMSMKLQDMSAMSEQQAMTMKMMAWMPIIFGIMFYRGASGLVIYWTVSTLVSIFEFKFFKKARDAAIEKARAAVREGPAGPAGKTSRQVG